VFTRTDGRRPFHHLLWGGYRHFDVLPRVGRDAGRTAEEVISHLVGKVGADVTVRLESTADLPKGASDQVVRTVTENGRNLGLILRGSKGSSRLGIEV
jgi:hypothetical protein